MLYIAIALWLVGAIKTFREEYNKDVKVVASGLILALALSFPTFFVVSDIGLSLAAAIAARK